MLEKDYKIIVKIRGSSFYTDKGRELSNKLSEWRTFSQTLQMMSKLTVSGGGGK